MIVEIDTDKLENHGLTPNDYVALFLKANGLECAFPINMVELQRQGYIKITDVGFDLRKEGLLLTKSTNSGVEQWIDSYRDLFPKGNTPDGYPFKGTKDGCLKKMKAFVKKYPYSTEEILSATIAFIEAKRRKGFEYMTLAHYFIEKDGISLLASICEANRENEFGSVLIEDNNEDI